MAYIEKLIDLIKAYPILYNLSHDEYRNNKKKDKIWRLIGLQLNEKSDELKKKWKNLKDIYMRYLKQTRIKNGRSGKLVRKWKWSDKMEPFRPFFFTRMRKSTNITSISDDNSTNNTHYPEIMVYKQEEENNMDLGEPQLQIHNNNNFTFEEINNQREDMSLLNQREDVSLQDTRRKLNHELKSMTPIDTLCNNELDEIDVLFLAYAKTIKTFSRKRQVIAKMKVAEVIMEQELQNVEEEERK